MKIGIITLQLHRNYGGILQNYALQQILKSLGHNPITIDKRPERNNIRFILSYLKHLFYKLLRRNTTEIFYFEHTTRSKQFSRFVNKHISLTSSVAYYSEDILKKYRCELLVVGSDQVWRRAFFSKDDIKNYFGAFLKSSNIPIMSYAASFGINKWDYEKDLASECKLLASKFSGISTRENSGVLLCQNLGINNAVAVLDPTMLLTSDDYCKVCDMIPRKGNKILFSYLLDYSQANINLVHSIANDKGLTPIIVQSEFHAQLSIEEWLSYFRDCEYVVTDSFHGTVFSILFKKEFSTIINEVRGGDRFYSLLDRINLTDRIVSPSGKYNTDNIIWDNVFAKLDDWRRKSIDYIVTAITQGSKSKHSVLP